MNFFLSKRNFFVATQKECVVRSLFCRRKLKTSVLHRR